MNLKEIEELAKEKTEADFKDYYVYIVQKNLRKVEMAESLLVKTKEEYLNNTKEENVRVMYRNMKENKERY